jgi:hypothetical protein
LRNSDLRPEQVEQNLDPQQVNPELVYVSCACFSGTALGL